jgi:hypothetical protein
VNALQSGQSITDAINFATQQAINGNQGYLNGALNSNAGGGSSGSSSGTTFGSFSGGQ